MRAQANVTSHRSSLVGLARSHMPDVLARAPRWVFTEEAFREILSQWDETSFEDRVRYFSTFQPRPELVVQFGEALVTFLHRSSPLFYRYVGDPTRWAGGVDHLKDSDSCLCRVYCTREVVSRHRGDAIEAASYAQETAHLLYVARALAADRYFDRRAGERTRSESRGRVHVEEVAVRWDAPTLRYHGRTESPSHVSEPGPPKCLHSVREHLRQYKSGKVAYVRPHTRGDESVPRKTVTRVEGRGSRQ